ncbi:hypothetical protein GUJ93_ZPchr0009g1524 [Zizania palustris]|uniref:Uncharacterized protein n=1 Tax=Zizania palustris TaxID=103762 RepID=A0A8J5RP80_ZIZPA|nr:hypothetical protein GUJ93_ZPchr0009g1524 [Zizania palustris]
MTSAQLGAKRSRSRQSVASEMAPPHAATSPSSFVLIVLLSPAAATPFFSPASPICRRRRSLLALTMACHVPCSAADSSPSHAPPNSVAVAVAVAVAEDMMMQIAKNMVDANCQIELSDASKFDLVERVAHWVSLYMARGQAGGMDWPPGRRRAPRGHGANRWRARGLVGAGSPLGWGGDLTDLYAGATRAVTVTEGDERSGCCQVGRILAASAPPKPAARRPGRRMGARVVLRRRRADATHIGSDRVERARPYLLPSSRRRFAMDGPDRGACGACGRQR